MELSPRLLKQREIFTAISFIHGIGRDEMTTLPIERVGALVADLYPAFTIDPVHLRLAVQSYSTGKMQ